MYLQTSCSYKKSLNPILYIILRSTNLMITVYVRKFDIFPDNYTSIYILIFNLLHCRKHHENSCRLWTLHDKMSKIHQIGSFYVEPVKFDWAMLVRWFIIHQCLGLMGMTYVFDMNYEILTCAKYITSLRWS